MILGCGIDLIEVARIDRELVRLRPHDRDGLRRDFDDVLTHSEIERCRARRRPAIGYAAGFAAKEACFKALGTGKIGSMSWHDVEIGHEDGRYTVALSGETAAVATRLGVDQIHLSIASTGREVVAFVVMEGPPSSAFVST